VSDTVKSDGNHWNRSEMNFSIPFEYRAKVKGEMSFAEGASMVTGSVTSFCRTSVRWYTIGYKEG